MDHDAAQVIDVHNYRYASCCCALYLIIAVLIINFRKNCYSIDLFLRSGYRIFVATWNVAGKSPPSYLSLEDWLHSSPPADIYVLG